MHALASSDVILIASIYVEPMSGIDESSYRSIVGRELHVVIAIRNNRTIVSSDAVPNLRFTEYAVY